MADANRQKAVREIKIQENILEVEGQKNVSLINNQILEVSIIYRAITVPLLLFSDSGENKG